MNRKRSYAEREMNLVLSVFINGEPLLFHFGIFGNFGDFGNLLS